MHMYVNSLLVDHFVSKLNNTIMYSLHHASLNHVILIILSRHSTHPVGLKDT